MASSTAPRGSGVLAVQATYDLQSADWCCNLRLAYQTAVGLYPLLFYKESALFLGFYSGFTSREYHVIRVDFIVALRRTKGRGRRTLRSPPSPSSGLHLIHPGNPLRRGGCRLPRAWGNIGICIQVLSLLPSSECCAAICVRAGIVRVSVGLLGLFRSFFIIGGWTVRTCGYVRFFYGLS